MRITDKDRKIYEYIERTGFATVKQIANIFFYDITYKNELAKKRLNCLVEHKHVMQLKSINCQQHIYCTDDKFKRQTYHNIVVLDLYSNFLSMRDLKVLKFEREKQWAGGKVISDAFLTVSYKDKVQSFFVEVQASKNPWKNTINKYADQEVLQEMYETCGGVFPNLIYVDEVMHDMDQFEGIPYEIKQTDMNLRDFPLIFDGK